MESFCNSSRKKQEFSQANRDRLLSLPRRGRFHTTAVDDAADDNVNNNNSILSRNVQASGFPYYPLQYTLGRNAVVLPNNQGVDSTTNIDPTSSSYGTSTFPPVFNNGHPFYYLPSTQGIFPPIPSVLRPADTSRIVENEVDDDDVFASSNNRTFSNHSSIASHFTNRPNIPFNSVPFELLQSRKRAHSAGDMIGLGLPNHVQYIYPHHGHVNVPLHNISVSKAEPSTPFLNNSASKYIPPQKLLITDRPIPASLLAPLQHNVPLPASAVANSMSSSHSQRVKPRVSEISSEGMLPHQKKEIPIQLTQIEASSRSSCRKKKILNKKHHTQQPQPSTKASGPSQTVLKTSTSKSVTKKKVGWNDLKNQEKSPSHVQQPDSVTLNLDIELIKENPLKFTAENTIGPYLVGPKLGNCPVRSISQYLVRKSNSSKYYMAKILRMNGEDEVKCGKMLLHTEHSLLSLLHSQSGVIRQHGIFKDCSYNIKTQTIIPRVCLILDCLTPHEYNSDSNHFLNLQQYVIQLKRLNEHEAIRIFYSIVSVVYSLHKMNVVHRDLKLGNMVLDKRNRRIILTNFGLGCHLTNDRDLLTDQRGSPAYISPDVLSDKPYAGKPSDMWSLGVILYTMLYGQFPFYDQEPKKLFSKIKAVDYTIPETGQISANTNNIIRSLLTAEPNKRLTARDALEAMETEAASRSLARSTSFQVVPDLGELQVEEAANTDGNSKTNPVNDEEKLTRDFQRKMMSDDEDDSSSSLNKAVRRCKRQHYRSSLAFRQNSCLPSNDCYRFQELRPVGANV